MHFDPVPMEITVKLSRADFPVLLSTSHTPCGDASIVPMNEAEIDSEELQPTNPSSKSAPKHRSDIVTEEPQCKKRKFDKLQGDVHRTGAKCVEDGPQDPKFPGTEHHILGVLRTKPGRGDRTLSMSCSDKMAKWNILGIQGSLLMNFLETPIYMDSIVIGKCPFSGVAMQRAIVDRFLPSLTGVDIFPFKQQSVQIAQSSNEFGFSKACISRVAEAVQPCPSSIAWNVSSKQVEVAVEGKKQGATKKTQGLPSGRLEVCRKNLFQHFANLLLGSKKENLPPHLKEYLCKLSQLTYFQAKQLSGRYAEVWCIVRQQTMQTWTQKESSLMEFTTQEK